MTKRLALAACLAALAGGCGSLFDPPVDDMAAGYVQVALQVAQHNPDLVDDWRGPEAWRPGPRQPIAPLIERINTLQVSLSHSRFDLEPDDIYRLEHLEHQTLALRRLALRLRGDPQTFDDELTGISTAAIDSAGALSARQALDRTLPGSGPLAGRYAAYRKGLAVSAELIEPVMRAALGACRQASGAMRLPADESVELVFGHGSQWDGFARYLGNHRTRIEINLDAQLDVTRALRLACHEGYPGHHAQNVLIDDELVKKRGWLEFALVPSFGDYLFVTEGAAEVGADLAFPSTKRVDLYRTILLPAAKLAPTGAERLVNVEDRIAALEPVIADVTRAYLENRISQAAAIDRLRDEALTAEPEALLAFVERRRARSLAYALGREGVRKRIGGAGIDGLRRIFTDEPFRVF
jgi:hypothetical protein